MVEVQEGHSEQSPWTIIILLHVNFCLMVLCIMWTNKFLFQIDNFSRYLEMPSVFKVVVVK